MPHTLRYLGVTLTVALIAIAAGFSSNVTSDESEATDLTVVEQSDWPREIVTNRGIAVIYEPQLEKLEGLTLSVRAAVGIEHENQETLYGVVWFEARLETDRENRIALITDLDVTEVRFPDQTEEQVKNLSELLESEIPKWNLPIEMDELIAALEVADTVAESAQSINTTPPVILFHPEPAVLIIIDGEPHLVDSEEQNIQRVMNTPFTILYDTKKKDYYLYADKDSWYKAAELKGQWQSVHNVPMGIAKQAPAEDPDEAEATDGEEEIETGPLPKIIVATEPTELISSNGKPEYEAIEGTLLMSISNTDSDVLLDTASNQHFILLSGRWFVSKTLDGPWSYVSSQDLPEDFAKIPEDSEMGTVLYAVAGTDVAREAVLDAQIPQTAAVEKKKANLSVEYDGTPKFENIDSTQMHWASNTATPVIKVNNTYYAVDEAVWFVSASAQGPWAVATSVPDVIYTIPPESAVFNVTFVRIYGETDDVVYVGYTPGYTNTYVYNTTIVYGTGYYYPGWYGRYYYPRYVTWGFHVRWNPWIGWGYGFSYGYGPFRFAVGVGLWYRGGWFGPGRYRGYSRGYRRGYRLGRRAGYRAGNRYTTQRNIYGSNRNKARTTTSTSAARNNARSNAMGNRTQAGGAAHGGRANNVYADRNGNVHRQTAQGWEQRSGNSWKTTDGRSQAAGNTRQQRSQQSTANISNDLNRSSNARQKGYQRSSSYRQSYGGARRSGGRRR